jgi:hypothetical protein
MTGKRVPGSPDAPFPWALTKWRWGYERVSCIVRAMYIKRETAIKYSYDIYIPSDAGRPPNPQALL